MAGLRMKKKRCIREAFGAHSYSMKMRQRRRAFFHTKFSDAYCSYSEDRSLYSSYSMRFGRGRRHRGVKPVQIQDVPEAGALGDISPLEDQQLVLTPENSVLPLRESHGDIYMAPENDLETPMEVSIEEKSASPAIVVELYEVSQKSGPSAAAIWPQVPECSSPMDVEPSKSGGFLENAITAVQQQPPLPEWDGGV